MHSTFSDGSDSPSRLMELAAAADVTTVALTDHDTVAGISEARAAADRHGIGLVPGVELSCHASERNVHLLGYFIDPEDELFLERLSTQRDSRDTRNERLASRLAELGMPVDLDQVCTSANGESVGRPHFAAEMMRLGYVASVDEAFLRFLADGAPAYVERRELDAATGVQWIHDAGGVASWAHPVWPGKTSLTDTEATLEELTDAGLDALECRYGRYDGDTRKALLKRAERQGLLSTGGTDYHGTYKPDLRIGVGLGDLAVPEAVLTEITAFRNTK